MTRHSRRAHLRADVDQSANAVLAVLQDQCRDLRRALLNCAAIVKSVGSKPRGRSDGLSNRFRSSPILQPCLSLWSKFAAFEIDLLLFCLGPILVSISVRTSKAANDMPGKMICVEWGTLWDRICHQ